MPGKPIGKTGKNSQKKNEDRRRQRTSTSPPAANRTGKRAAPTRSKSVTAPTAGRAKAIQERKLKEEKKLSDEQAAAQWTGSLRDEFYKDKPAFDLDTKIPGYENLDERGKIKGGYSNYRQESDRRRQGQKDQEISNKKWSHSLREEFHADDDWK